MWNGLGYLPSTTVLDMRDLLPIARIWIFRREHRTVVLPEIVHHAEEAAVGRKTDLVARRVDLVEGDFPMILCRFDDLVLIL